MKIKMAQIPILDSIFARMSSEKVRLKTAYKISKLLQATEKEMDFYNEKMGGIIEKYGKRNENGQLEFSEDGSTVLLRTEDIQECQNEILELQSIEVELPDVEFSIDELETFEISAQDLSSLTPFLNE